MIDPYEKFQRFCIAAGLKSSKPREKVAQLFLSSQEHLSVFRAYEKLKEQGENIGYSTVYRTLNLLVKAGLAETITYQGETYYENKAANLHHDHLVCNKCGKTIEFSCASIERLQTAIARKHNFQVQSHSLILYGLCKDCNKEKKAKQ
ncbi:MAG: transcriptional repressor [candidate division WOR-3 bacterium]|nr:transcriptional repressor [candidate division WOR-3 bacterium]MCX7757310.1 transcriptional repressor [candidate division WOR-3 bacterium]MDW7988193.1 Fur family transcriptional regulator [candidate division WOR-3 bacterium]